MTAEPRRIYQTNFGRFNDGRWLFLGGILQLTGHLGWHPGRTLEKWIAETLEEKTGNGNLTFGDLHRLAERKGDFVNRETLGLRVDTLGQIAFYEGGGPSAGRYEIESFRDHCEALYNCAIDNLYFRRMREYDMDRTIMISPCGIGPKIKRLSKKKDLLLECGVKAVENFFGRTASPLPETPADERSDGDHQQVNEP